jgi:hypothetical protein
MESRSASWETVRQQRPELVVVAPCGFDHARAAREASPPPLGCRAVAVDSNAYYARPAPRVADGVAQLAFLIHPDLIDDPGLPYVELAAQAVGPTATVVADRPSRTSEDWQPQVSEKPRRRGRKTIVRKWSTDGRAR